MTANNSMPLFHKMPDLLAPTMATIVISSLVVLIGLAVEGLSSTNPIMYGIGASIISIVVFSYLFPSSNLKSGNEALEDRQNAL
ncbi:hypothetical protein [Geobacillus jurassicus]|uniref:Uncharacterized protein n=1 Tax=Geobacillus jurassicus TaxID=235932 RepID=A0ABV6GQD1_9BACL|nr:hypothetical protein [Geobacillus jurassicus]